MTGSYYIPLLEHAHHFVGLYTANTALDRIEIHHLRAAHGHQSIAIADNMIFKAAASASVGGEVRSK